MTRGRMEHTGISVTGEVARPLNEGATLTGARSDGVEADGADHA